MNTINDNKEMIVITKDDFAEKSAEAIHNVLLSNPTHDFLTTETMLLLCVRVSAKIMHMLFDSEVELYCE